MLIGTTWGTGVVSTIDDTAACWAASVIASYSNTSATLKRLGQNSYCFMYVIGC